MRRFALGGLFCSLFLLAFLGGRRAPSVQPAAAPADAGEKVYQQTLKSTVWILVPRGDGKASSGTGSLVDRVRGLVLTNYHVVDENDSAKVHFPIYERGKLVAERSHYTDQLRKGGGIRAKVVARDSKRDLAFLQLERVPDGAAALKLAADSVNPGQRVHSIGNPGASGALWVYTSGTVRQVYNKKFKTGGKSGDTFTVEARVVETQSPVNPGDSGGPVVNDRGELVAVTQGHAADEAARLVSYFIDIGEVRSLMADKGLTRLAALPANPATDPKAGAGEKPPDKPKDVVKPASQPLDEAAKAEEEAVRKLRFAKNLVEAGKQPKAREVLEEIVKTYPKTKAAEEARELLKTIPK